MLELGMRMNDDGRKLFTNGNSWQAGGDWLPQANKAESTSSTGLSQQSWNEVEAGAKEWPE